MIRQPRDLSSISGTILIVLSQIFSSYQSSDSISKEITKFRSEFQQSIVDRETYFVRKTQLSVLSAKIDLLGRKIRLLKDDSKCVSFGNSRSFHASFQ